MERWEGLGSGGIDAKIILMPHELQRMRLIGASALPFVHDGELSLAGQVRDLLAGAAHVLWAFYKRPLERGTSWHVPRGLASSEQFQAACRNDPSYLVSLCQSIQGHDALSAAEEAVVAEVASLATLFGPGLCPYAGLSSGPQNASGERSKPAPAHSYERALSGIRADLRLGVTQYRIKLSAVSKTGLLIVGGPLSSLGQHGTVGLRGGAWIEGRVAWEVDGRSGFAFAFPEDSLVTFVRRLFADGHFDC